MSDKHANVYNINHNLSEINYGYSGTVSIGKCVRYRSIFG